jgi:hypothetical protein
MIHGGEQRSILQDALSLCIVDALGVKMLRFWKELVSEEEKSCKHPLVLQWEYLMIHRD